MRTHGVSQLESRKQDFSKPWSDKERDVSGTDLGAQLSGFTGAQGSEAGNSSRWHGVTSSVGPQSQRLWAIGHPLDFADCFSPIP